MGRRVQLIQAFRRAGESLGLRLEVHGADASVLSPAIHLVDNPHLVPPIAAEGYVDAMLDIVRRNRIQLLVPLLDFELPLLAPQRDRFAHLGCCVLISSAEVVETCRDKWKTFQTLRSANIDTPTTWLWRDVIQMSVHHFPYYMKPQCGSAGVGNFVIHDEDELRTLGRRVQDPIVQEFIEGTEYTLDVYCGLNGIPRCVVPRRRIEVRNGEVSKGVVVKDAGIMAIGKRTASALGDCRGVVTVQCMKTNKGSIRVIEINPRFGGGAPLAIHAGADFPKWILTELIGGKPRINPTGFRNDVVMLRYDEAVFVPNATRLTKAKFLRPVSRQN